MYKFQPDQGNWKHITGPQFQLIMTEVRDVTNTPPYQYVIKKQNCSMKPLIVP